MHECPCGTGKSFQACCHRFIAGIALPSTPEELMRSRFTAYTLLDINYIEKTMKSPANDDFNAEEALSWATQVTWTHLDVINSQVENKKGTVEFLAHYTYKNKPYVLHEISEFDFDNNKWFYKDGKTPEKKQGQLTGNKIPRNEPCPCGSGNKYKKCCGKIL